MKVSRLELINSSIIVWFNNFYFSLTRYFTRTLMNIVSIGSFLRNLYGECKINLLTRSLHNREIPFELGQRRINAFYLLPTTMIMYFEYK